MKMKDLVPIFALAGLVMAEGTGLVIPPDQPICKLYSIIQLLGVIGAILVMAYAGFHLATSHELTERNNAKMLISGSIIGIAIIWMAPLLVQNLVSTTSVCGW